jgi:hypothetical protein
MIQKAETRTDRLNKLSRLAKRDEPITLENRAHLEISAHLGNHANQSDPIRRVGTLWGLRNTVEPSLG